LASTYGPFFNDRDTLTSVQGSGFQVPGSKLESEDRFLSCFQPGTWHLEHGTYFLRFTINRSEDFPFFRVLRSTLPQGLQGWRPPEVFPSPPPSG
jgi:hypothetical protein